MGKYLIDIIRSNRLIEIQTGNFSAIKAKIEDLVKRHQIRLVYPIAQTKWIVRLDSQGERISCRRSPRKGRVEDLFLEMVYIPHLMVEPNFSLEVLFIHSEEILVDDGLGSWRRKRWSIHDRRLLCVVGRTNFSIPANFLQLLPDTLPEKFTTRELADSLKLRVNIAQKMTYSLSKMNVIKNIRKQGRTKIYTIIQ